MKLASRSLIAMYTGGRFFEIIMTVLAMEHHSLSTAI